MINHEILSRSGPWEALETLTIPVEPQPAPRPRLSRRGKAEYPPQFNQWRDDVADHLGKGEPKFLGPLAVAVEMVSKRPTRSSRDWPRFDGDNGYKAITDCITKSKTLWQDDDQIIIGLFMKRWADDDEQPHVRLDVYGRPS